MRRMRLWSQNSGDYVVLPLAGAKQMPAFATFWRNARPTAAPKATLNFARLCLMGIVDLSASVADAAEGKAPASPDILPQFEAISDPEERTRFYAEHKPEIWKAQGIRQLDKMSQDTKRQT